MKVLWFSNCQLRESEILSTGTWIQSMATGLLTTGELELAVIALADVPRLMRQDFQNVQQWLLPSKTRLRNNGLPTLKLVKEIVSVCDLFQPDLVHIWGVECFWGLLTARKYIRVPTLLEMQGIKKAIAKHVTADLTVKELFQCIGIKEILKRKIIVSYQKDFAHWGKFEEEILHGHSFIDVQSEWMSAQVNSIQPNAQQFYVDLALRSAFYSARPWMDFNKERILKAPAPYVFCSSSGSAAYKGIHVALRVLAELKQKFPQIRLHIAGNIQNKGLRQEGYVLWLKYLSRKLKVEENVDWLGPLNAEQIINELQLCEVNVVCSFVESYCLALAEPMYLGVPCVTSFSGGTSWIAEDDTNALFYPSGDHVMCAHQIFRVFSEPELRNELSTNARKAGLKRHNLDCIVKEQLVIYKKVIDDMLK
jgi:glycosyltransferase involved in cell wall biosynthesis